MTAWARRLCRAAFAALAFALVVLLQSLQPAYVARFDEGLRDIFVRLHASEQPEERIAVVDIDDGSIQELGPWPWPRARVADLVEVLVMEQGARKVALDIVFTRRGDEVGDERLALLLENMPVTEAQVLDYTGGRGEPLEEGMPNGGMELGAGFGLGSELSSRPEKLGYLQAHGHMANHEFFSGARCAGNVGFVPDADGVLRRLPTLSVYEGLGYVGLSDAMMRCATPSSPSDVAHPVDGFYSRSTWRVPYTRAQSAYTVVSAGDVLANRLPEGLLKGRYVLVGSSSLSLGDRVSTPLAPLTAGLMVHAAALSGLLDLRQGVVSLPADGSGVVVLWCLVFFSLAVWVVARGGALVSMAYLVGASFAWLALAYQMAARQYELSLVSPLLGILALLVTLVPLEWWLSQAQGRNLRSTLSRYVARPVIDAITKSGDFQVLVPQARTVTVLVADMADYTRQTSSVPLEEMVELTREFLDCITGPVLEKGGTLDKYMGDGLLAFWGAPLPCENSADLAIEAALQILADFAKLNARRAERGLEPIGMRIGVEGGDAVVGEMGTRFRTTYTAIGECVNHASRIEAAASKFGVSLLVGPVAAGMSSQHALRLVGSLDIRGTDSQIDVYTCGELGPAELQKAIVEGEGTGNVYASQSLHQPKN